jgi:hypothetical protein
MEDFFDTMTEEEIKRVLTQFFSQSVFDELNDPKEHYLCKILKKNR